MVKPLIKNQRPLANPFTTDNELNTLKNKCILSHRSYAQEVALTGKWIRQYGNIDIVATTNSCYLVSIGLLQLLFTDLAH